MAIVYWSYPHQAGFTKIEGALSRHSWNELNSLSNCFVLCPFHAENGFYTINGAIQSNISEVKVPVEWMASLVKNAPKVTATDYKDSVGKGLQGISDGRLEKIVLSRCQDVSSELLRDDFLAELKIKNPGALISLILSEELGCWVTASPELLLKKSENNFTSFSLAGTQIKEQQEIGKKEQKEQNIVTSYIVDVFKRHGLNTKIADQRKKNSGEIEHLLNEISAQSNLVNSLSDLVAGLHPTPAVAGLPLQSALEFLDIEGYARELYAGFQGFMKNEEDFSFYVNLRIAQIYKDVIRFYAGAGIIQGSIPEREFSETASKMAVLQSVLLKQYGSR